MFTFFCTDTMERERLRRDLARDGKVVGRQLPVRLACGEVREYLISAIPVRFRDQPATLAVLLNLSERLDADRSVASGMNGQINKPIDPRKLYEAGEGCWRLDS